MHFGRSLTHFLFGFAAKDEAEVPNKTQGGEGVKLLSCSTFKLHNLWAETFNWLGSVAEIRSGTA